MINGRRKERMREREVGLTSWYIHIHKKEHKQTMLMVIFWEKKIIAFLKAFLFASFVITMLNCYFLIKYHRVYCVGCLFSLLSLSLSHCVRSQVPHTNSIHTLNDEFFDINTDINKAKNIISIRTHMSDWYIFSFEIIIYFLEKKKKTPRYLARQGTNHLLLHSDDTLCVCEYIRTVFKWCGNQWFSFIIFKCLTAITKPDAGEKKMSTMIM